MSMATLSSKGQITIPKEIRDELGLGTGSQVMFVRLPDGRYQMVPRTGTAADLIGMLHDPEVPALSLEEMDRAIADGAAASGLDDAAFQ